MLVSTGSGHLIAANKADQEKMLILRPDGRSQQGLPGLHSEAGYNLEVMYHLLGLALKHMSDHPHDN
jgi:hypothetical protein